MQEAEQRESNVRMTVAQPVVTDTQRTKAADMVASECRADGGDLRRAT